MDSIRNQTQRFIKKATWGKERQTHTRQQTEIGCKEKRESRTESSSRTHTKKDAQKMKLKILEIGAGPKPQAQLIWPDADIETLDVDSQYNPTYLHNAETMLPELYEKYDAVLASHVLEHFVNYRVRDVLMEWKKAVKINTGQVHVVVPSFEWAAEQALSEHPSRGTLPHLFGGQTTEWDIHKVAFTMRHLRVLFDSCGLAVIRARTGPYNINAYGEIVVAEQHYICGVRKPENEIPEMKLEV